MHREASQYDKDDINRITSQSDALPTSLTSQSDAPTFLLPVGSDPSQLTNELKFLVEGGISKLTFTVGETKTSVQLTQQQRVSLNVLKANCERTLPNWEALVKINQCNLAIFKKLQKWVPKNSRLAVGICHGVVMGFGGLYTVEARMVEWCDDVRLWDVCLVREFHPQDATEDVLMDPNSVSSMTETEFKLRELDAV